MSHDKARPFEGKDFGEIADFIGMVTGFGGAASSRSPFDGLFGRPADRLPMLEAEHHSSPSLETIWVDVAGIQKEDIDVTLEGSTLTVTVTRRPLKTPAIAEVKCRFTSGVRSRSFEVRPSPTSISAVPTDGVLKIVMNYAPDEHDPVKIKIT